MQVRDWGVMDYLLMMQAMQRFTQERSHDEPDQLWLCQHPPTFTQGLAGKPEHLLMPPHALSIPVIQTNRGGQVTYHGLGQCVAYPLMDLRRAGYFVKEYVYRLEEAAIRTLAHVGITGHRVPGAPGIYVRWQDPTSHAALKTSKDETAQSVFMREQLGKIAALGIKVSRHYAYHGIALNARMDLEPFAYINPCGYAGLRAVDMASLGVLESVAEIQAIFTQQLLRWLVK